jgi:hypothetical protein
VRKTLLAAAIFSSVVPLLASSYYPARLDDTKAIYRTQENFSVKGDGIADDSAVLQQAINQIQEKINSATRTNIHVGDLGTVEGGVVPPFENYFRLACGSHQQGAAPGLLRNYREKWAFSAYFEGRAGGISLQLRLVGGESGIRTHVTLSSKHAFQACAFSHSAISPARFGRTILSAESYRQSPSLHEASTRLHFILWAAVRKCKSVKPWTGRL